MRRVMMTLAGSCAAERSAAAKWRLVGEKGPEAGKVPADKRRREKNHGALWLLVVEARS